MTNYFKYKNETFWFDENIKLQIDKAMEDYAKAMKSLKALENLGIEIPRDSRTQLRFKLSKGWPSDEERQIIHYTNYRMSEIDVELGIHNCISRF